jgi:hypothetical protein
MASHYIKTDSQRHKMLATSDGLLVSDPVSMVMSECKERQERMQTTTHVEERMQTKMHVEGVELHHQYQNLLDRQIDKVTSIIHYCSIPGKHFLKLLVAVSIRIMYIPHEDRNCELRLRVLTWDTTVCA